MHAEIKVGDSIIMFAASTPQYAPMTAPFFIYVKDADATYGLALEKGQKLLQKWAINNTAEAVA